MTYKKSEAFSPRIFYHRYNQNPLLIHYFPILHYLPFLQITLYTIVHHKLSSQFLQQRLQHHNVILFILDNSH